MNQRGNRRRARAERLYRWIVRAYPARHRRLFGQQMLHTFQDHYRDVVEGEGQGESRFWMGVARDAGSSVIWERAASLRDTLRERPNSMKSTLLVTLTALGMLLLLGLRVWLSPAVLGAPHGGGTASSGIAALAFLALAYPLVAWVLVRPRRAADVSPRAEAFRRAALLGALVGGVALGAIAVDALAGPDSYASGVVWSVAVVVAAAGWYLAGWMATRGSGSVRLGIVAALWSGMVSALVAATAELASTLLALPQLAQHELSNPDYLYWRQPDVQSYAIASAVALGVAALILCPVAAGVVGGVGGWLGRTPSLASQREGPRPR